MSRHKIYLIIVLLEISIYQILQQKINFKYRERRDEPCVIELELKFIYNKAIETFLKKE